MIGINVWFWLNRKQILQVTFKENMSRDLTCIAFSNQYITGHGECWLRLMVLNWNTIVIMSRITISTQRNILDRLKLGWEFRHKHKLLNEQKI